MLLNDYTVTILAGLYLALLLAVAYYGDRRADSGRSLINSGTVYSLSLAVYATSWTYYGGVGQAAVSGLGFLPVYIGPTLMFAVGWVILHKIIRIGRKRRITSLADFISARYGQSTRLGGLVTIVAVVGLLPFIALQLKTVANSCTIIRLHPHVPTKEELAHVPYLEDTGLYLTFFLAAFVIVFGTRHLDASERHEGMVAAIAMESVVKLLVFLAAGFFVVFGIFNGFGNLFHAAAQDERTASLLSVNTGRGYGTWAWTTVLSMLAVVLLPRQWQVTFVENVDERHLRKAAWMFPVYLLAINFFVLPIALAGLLRFGPTSQVDPDTYLLALPLAQHQDAITLLVFIGGLSTATGMIIVETIALSTMVSNFLVLPILLRVRSQLVREGDLTKLILGIRRAAIIGLLVAGYVYFRVVGQGAALVSFGLLSFVAVAQFAPAVLGGLFWRDGTRLGALVGLTGGFLTWIYTLLIPTLMESGWLPGTMLRTGPFGIELLRPQELFGLTGMDQISHAMFWSMLVNVGGYIAVSLFHRVSPVARAEAAAFVDALEDPARVRRWYGRVTVGDLCTLVERFLGPAGARHALLGYGTGEPIDRSSDTEAEPEFVEYVETLLAGAVGPACARFVIASVTQEDPVRADTMREILDEASQTAALEERHRLARELHDSVSQALFSMTLHTRALELAVQREGWEQTGSAATSLAELRTLTQSALSEMRALIFQLRPGALHDEGLVVAVRRHAATVAAREGVDVRVQAPEERLPLGERAEQDLFRVIQEALHNSIKHAEPGRIDISLRPVPDGTRTLVVEVADDGTGFRPDVPHPGHMGLDGMRERTERLGGRFVIDSSPAGSTTVRAVVPGLLDGPAAAGEDDNATVQER